MGVPIGWTDANNVLTAPNGVKVIHGFRDYVLAHNWDAGNIPLAAEFGTSLLESSNPSLGGGSQQVFRWTMLGYTTQRGVFFEWIGQELAYARQQIQRYATQLQQSATQIQQLKDELAKAVAPTGLDPTKVANRMQSIELLATQIGQQATAPIS